jgi:hypothetical protein
MLFENQGDSCDSSLHFWRRVPTTPSPNPRSKFVQGATDSFWPTPLNDKLGKLDFVPFRPGYFAVSATSRVCFSRDVDQNIHSFVTPEFVLEQISEPPWSEK